MNTVSEIKFLWKCHWPGNRSKNKWTKKLRIKHLIPPDWDQTETSSKTRMDLHKERSTWEYKTIIQWTESCRRSKPILIHILRIRDWKLSCLSTQFKLIFIGDDDVWRCCYSTVIFTLAKAEWLSCHHSMPIISRRMRRVQMRMTSEV